MLIISQLTYTATNKTWTPAHGILFFPLYRCTKYSSMSLISYKGSDLQVILSRKPWAFAHQSVSATCAITALTKTVPPPFRPPEPPPFRPPVPPPLRPLVPSPLWQPVKRWRKCPDCALRIPQVISPQRLCETVEALRCSEDQRGWGLRKWEEQQILIQYLLFHSQRLILTQHLTHPLSPSNLSHFTITNMGGRYSEYPDYGYTPTSSWCLAFIVLFSFSGRTFISGHRKSSADMMLHHSRSLLPSMAWQILDYLSYLGPWRCRRSSGMVSSVLV